MNRIVIIVVIYYILTRYIINRKSEGFSLGIEKVVRRYSRGLIEKRINIERLKKKYEKVKRRNEENKRKEFDSNRNRALVYNSKLQLDQQRFLWLPNRFYNYDLSDKRYII